MVYVDLIISEFTYPFELDESYSLTRSYCYYVSELLYFGENS
jgi:hypothetical protein